MSLFEFLMVLVSIIIGLGLAELLTGVARQIRYRRTTKGYWVHSALVTVLFLAFLQAWWEIWGLRGVEEWTFLGLLLMLTGPIGFFLLAHLVFPEPVDGVDLREYYHGDAGLVWWLAALTVILATVFRPIVFGQNLFSATNATSFVIVAICVTLGSSQRPALHAILVPSLLLLLLLDVFQWSFSIGG